jgi:hypothetical protein
MHGQQSQSYTAKMNKARAQYESNNSYNTNLVNMLQGHGRDAIGKSRRHWDVRTAEFESTCAQLTRDFETFSENPSGNKVYAPSIKLKRMETLLSTVKSNTYLARKVKSGDQRVINLMQRLDSAYENVATAAGKAHDVYTQSQIITDKKVPAIRDQPMPVTRALDVDLLALTPPIYDNIPLALHDGDSAPTPIGSTPGAGATSPAPTSPRVGGGGPGGPGIPKKKILGLKEH